MPNPSTAEDTDKGTAMPTARAFMLRTVPKVTALWVSIAIARETI